MWHGVLYFLFFFDAASMAAFHQMKPTQISNWQAESEELVLLLGFLKKRLFLCFALFDIGYDVT